MQRHNVTSTYFYCIKYNNVNSVTTDGCVHITESVGCRRELVANSCTHRWRDATRQFRRVGVGGVYWALDCSDVPISGTASDVGGIVSATSCRKTVKDNRIVTPTTDYVVEFFSAMLSRTFDLFHITHSNGFLQHDATQSAVLPWRVVCLSVRPSVCLSVTLRYRSHIGWNS